MEETVDFDEVISTFDKPTRDNFRGWIKELAKAIENGRGEDLNDAFANFVAFTEDGNSVLEILDEQDPALRRLIKNTGVTLGAINRRYGEFGQFVTNANDFFGALASRNDALAETISIFPTFLDESRQTFDRLREFAIDTRPLVRELQPVALQLRPTLRDLGRLAPDLEHLFTQARAGDRRVGRHASGGGEVPALPERLGSVRRGPAGQQAAGRARVALSVPRGAQPDPDLPQLLPSAGGRVLHERRRLALRHASSR